MAQVSLETKQNERIGQNSNAKTDLENRHFFSLVLNYSNPYDFDPIIGADHVLINDESAFVNATNSTVLLWSVPFRNFSISDINVQFTILDSNQTDGHSGLSWQDENATWWYAFVRPKEIVLYNDRDGEVISRASGNSSQRELHSLSVSFKAHDRTCILFDDQLPICIKEKNAFAVSRVGLRSFNSVAGFGPISATAFYFIK